MKKHLEKDIQRIPIINFKDFSTKGIIVEDDREGVNEEIYPYNCVARLIIRDKNGDKVEGTGFFISERCLITAAHNIYLNNGFAKEVTVIPGANEYNDAPFGKETTTTLRCMKRWAEYRDDSYDYGAVILKDNTLFNRMKSCFRYESLETFDFSVELSGYPVDTYEKKGAQWKSKGKINNTDEKYLYYELDTGCGQSGSPVFIRKGNSCVVIGVHHYFKTYNRAIRVNETIVSKWNKWTKIDILKRK